MSHIPANDYSVACAKNLNGVTMNIILWIILGATAGWIASILSGAKSFKDSWPSIYIGAIGALLGGYYVHALRINSSASSFISLVVAVIGSIVVVTSYKAVKDD